MNMRELIDLVSRALVRNPDQVDVREFDEDGTLVLELRCAQEDAGRIIGRQGRTIKAMRTLLHAAGIRGNVHVRLDLIEG